MPGNDYFAGCCLKPRQSSTLVIPSCISIKTRLKKGNRTQNKTKTVDSGRSPKISDKQ